MGVNITQCVTKCDSAMLKFVSKALGRKKNSGKKRKKSRPPAPSQVLMNGAEPAVVEAPPLDDPASDSEMSLEELEGMMVATHHPEEPEALPAQQSEPEPVAPPPPEAKAAKAKPKARKAAQAQAPASKPAPLPAPQATPKAARRENSPERDQLIRDALNIQRSKQEVLAQLSVEEREKLYVMAMRTLVDKNFGDN